MAQLVPARFKGKTAVLIGGGPSLNVQQIGLLRHAHDAGEIVVMGCNDAFRICDFLDVLYAADRKWIEHHHESCKHRRMEKWCHSDPTADGLYPDWNRVVTDAKPGLSTDPAKLHRGDHSGFQLLNLAYLMGCRRIILIGYDCHSGGHHWFGPHPTPAMNMKTNFDQFVKHYTPVAKQLESLSLEVFNATPGSAIKVFPNVDLGGILYESKRS